jgi:hypothetical protein
VHAFSALRLGRGVLEPWDRHKQRGRFLATPGQRWSEASPIFQRAAAARARERS